MSEQLKHKMFDFEATPPPASWEVIAARLDDDIRYATVAAKMNNFDAAPPLSSWSTIASRLNDDIHYAGLATKMNHFQETPPQNIWSEIAARLDDDRQYATVAAKLNNFDATPPAQVWNNIAASFQKEEFKPIPVRNINTIIYRLAAAAILIGLFAGIWMLVNKNAVKVDVVKNKPAIVPDRSATRTDNKEDHTITPLNNSNQSKEEIAVADQNGERAVQAGTKNRLPFSTDAFSNNQYPALRHAVVDGLLAYQEKPIVISSPPILDKDGNVIRDMDVLTTSNYIVVTGPNGQSTRISSKFASVIRYLNGDNDDHEEYIDKVIKESDTWKKRFQEWRNKISQSSFIPSSANFLDIIEFKELIEEKK